LNLFHKIPEIICILETKLKNQPLINIELHGYTLSHNDSPTNAGGVAVNVANNISFELMPDYEMNICM